MTIFVFNDVDITARENAIKSGSLIAPFSPFSIHEFRDGDLIVGKESKIPSVRRLVVVKSCGHGQSWWC